MTGVRTWRYGWRSIIPYRVTHLIALDAVPIAEALDRADARFAQAWWHWFFLGQTAKPAERVINADPDAWYAVDPALMGEEAYEDLRLALHDPKTVHAMCEDYRAGLGVDRAVDEADRAAGRRIACPTLVLWATRDDLERPVRRRPRRLAWISGQRSCLGERIESGHHMAEEVPEELAERIARFIADRA